MRSFSGGHDNFRKMIDEAEPLGYPVVVKNARGHRGKHLTAGSENTALLLGVAEFLTFHTRMSRTHSRMVCVCCGAKTKHHNRPECRIHISVKLYVKRHYIDFFFLLLRTEWMLTMLFVNCSLCIYNLN